MSLLFEKVLATDGVNKFLRRSVVENFRQIFRCVPSLDAARMALPCSDSLSAFVKFKLSFGIFSDDGLSLFQRDLTVIRSQSGQQVGNLNPF